jgi:2,3-bisphosphoglycerate-dependent phosphoglycerate mutase
MKLIQILFIAILFCSCNTSTYYIVRHAEKRLDQGNNPSLTEQGFQRAQDLNTYFGASKPNRIFVSTLQRTQLTAAPTATAAGVTPLIYNHQIQDSLNLMLLNLVLQDRKKVLVVSHTDAIPKIVKALSNVDIGIMADNDYNNMYIIRLRKKGRKIVSFTATTYGQASP